MRWFPALALTFALLLPALPARAEISVHNAWVRATVGTGRPTAGYAEIENTGPADDVLVSVRTTVAAMAGVHQTVSEGGIMKMEPVAALPVPAGKVTKLEPGGYHIMIMDVIKPLKAGDTVDMTFTFKKQGPLKVTAKIAPLAAQKMP